MAHTHVTQTSRFTTCQLWSLPPQMYLKCHTYEWVMSHSYDWVMSHTRECVVSHMYAWVMSHMYAWVMAHTQAWRASPPQMHLIYYTYGRVMAQILPMSGVALQYTATHCNICVAHMYTDSYHTHKQICYAYVDPRLPQQMRHMELSRTFMFDCACGK